MVSTVEPRYTVKEAAQALGLGERVLFSALRRHRVLDERNVPTWRARRSGYFVDDERSYRHPTVGTRLYTRTFITESGIAWLRALLCPPQKDADAADTRRLLHEIAYLNPDAGEIGAGKLRHLVTEARRIIASEAAS